MSNSDPSMLLSALQHASSKKDVRDLIDKHGYEPVAKAWGQLDQLSRSSLSLVKAFDGVIIHGCELEPDSV